METSKIRRQAHVQISASEAFAKRKISLRFFVTTSVTPINYTLISSGSRLQPSLRTHGRFYYGRSDFGLTWAAPGISMKNYFNQNILP